MHGLAATCPDDRRHSAAHVFGAALKRALLWPSRVMAARRTLSQLAGMADYELRDIGLSRQDLADLTARPLDEDPTPYLARSRAAKAAFRPHVRA